MSGTNSVENIFGPDVFLFHFKIEYTIIKRKKFKMEIQNPDYKNFKSYIVILRSYLMTGQYILYGDLGQRTSKTPAPAIINPFTPANNRTPLNAQTNSCHMILKTKYDAQNTRYRQDFVQLGILGQGDFGEVFKVKSRIDGLTYAIKRTRHPLNGSRQEVQAVREVCAHAAIGTHDNVVRYFSAWSEGDRMLIQSEFCNGKSLLEEIVQRQSRPLGGSVTNGFNNEEIETLISHCAKGLAYIHCQNLAHMDIKPGNIFRQIDGNDGSCVYKIGDLGLVCPHTETVFDDGDCRYIARELIESITNKDNDLRMADVFSLGLTLLEAATLINLPKNGQIWQWLRTGTSNFIQNELQTKTHLSSNICHLILQMTADSQSDRPTATEIVDQFCPNTRKIKELQSQKENLQNQISGWTKLYDQTRQQYLSESSAEGRRSFISRQITM